MEKTFFEKGLALKNKIDDIDAMIIGYTQEIESMKKMTPEKMVTAYIKVRDALPFYQKTLEGLLISRTKLEKEFEAL